VKRSRHPKRKKGEPPPPEPTSRRDKIIIVAWIVGTFCVIGLFLHIAATLKARQELDTIIRRWSIDFNLNSKQADRIKSLERDFHGGGNPFTFPVRSQEQVRQHHEAIAAEMNPADGERFLHLQGETKAKH